MKTLLLLFVFALCTSCTHKVFRNNYHFDPKHQPGASVAIKKSPGSIDSLVNVGEIRLKDGWWVVICSEKEALDLLKKEAHQLRADVIHISKEKRPDIESSCYRCEATFYQFKYPGMAVQSDSAYTADAIQARHKKDNKKKAFLGIGSVMVGLGIGILIGIVYL